MATVVCSHSFINEDVTTAVPGEMALVHGVQLLQAMTETGFGVIALEEKVLL